jgi:hypothetical protein
VKSFYPTALRFDPKVCKGQFVLSRRRELVPEGWRARSHAGWVLGYSRPLTCTEVRTGDRLIGWLLGHAVDESGAMLGEASRVSLSSDSPGDFRAWSDGLTGRFIAIHFESAGPMLYQDIYGMLAGVFSREESIAASTGLLIPLTPGTQFSRGRVMDADLPYRSAMYPLGITAREGVERLLPNHVLDLAARELRRVWPLEGFEHDGSPEETAAETALVVTRAMAGVRAVHPLQIPLTAGLDSRLLLACARELPDGTMYFTADLGDENGWIDVIAARQLAQRFGLNHQVFPWRTARRADLAEWAIRTGAETGEERGWRATRTLGMQAPGRASMTGFVGELARAYWWKGFTPASRVTPEFLMGKCRMPTRPEYLARIRSWLAGLPPLSNVAVADVLYLEQRGACWAGIVEYGELGGSEARLAPLCQAKLVRQFLRLPHEYRERNGIHMDVIRARWPELLDFPFNQGFPLPPARKRYFALRGAIARRAHRVGRMWRVLRNDPARVWRLLSR